MTTRGLKVGLASGLGRGLRALAARSLGSGVLGFDLFLLAAFGLATRGLPAAEQFPAP